MKNQSVIEPIKFLTPDEAARTLGMRRTAFLRHVTAGRITPNAKIGRHPGFSLASVEAFRAQRERDGVKRRGPQPWSEDRDLNGNE